MTYLTRRNGFSTDPFSLARELFQLQPLAKPAQREVEFRPRFDLVERDGVLLVRADLPGVLESNLEIKLDNSLLSISGERHSEKREEDDKYHVYERFDGRFTRTFKLPETVDAEAIEAKLDAGVLTVRVPLKQEGQARVIPVAKK